MIDLQKGDCLELMKKIPSNSIDLILTDSPYGINFQSNYRKNKHLKIQNDSNLDWLDHFVFECNKVLKNDSALMMFSSWHHVDYFKASIEKYFKIKNILIWEKNNTGMGDLKGQFAPKYEFIFFAVKGKPLLKGKRDSDILNFKKTGNKLHPTQKPVDLLKYLINKLTDESNTVLDPFMGSGSTGVACVNTNRDFIGMELDDEYFKIAQKRIREAKDEKVTKLV
ncbi:MAG: DNA methyltransferase [Liquorilactobacillus sp.]|uniref:DNA-methyltransferase n=1 Tax=Liquorilactobacillus sp. TaxID=2767923 RepID=UPI0039ECEB11